MAPMGKQGTHFWFMTVHMVANGQPITRSFHGTVTPLRGETRFDLFNRLVADVAEADPRTANGGVQAFDVQPNKL